MRHGGFSYLVQIVMLTDYYVMFSVVEVKGQIFCDSSAEKILVLILRSASPCGKMVHYAALSTHILHALM